LVEVEDCLKPVLKILDIRVGYLQVGEEIHYCIGKLDIDEWDIVKDLDYIEEAPHKLHGTT
jgi:hypothetical protein